MTHLEDRFLSEPGKRNVIRVQLRLHMNFSKLGILAFTEAIHMDRMLPNMAKLYDNAVECENVIAPKISQNVDAKNQIWPAETATTR